MKLIFLTYVNRSGSTFLANLFSKLEDVCVCPEANILVELFLERPENKMTKKVFNQLHSKFINHIEYQNWKINKTLFDNFSSNDSHFDCFKKIVKSYRALNKPHAKTILFKSERLINLYDSINKANWEQDKLYWIALIRDCRAVYNSQHNIFWPGSNTLMSSNPVRTARFWNNFVNSFKKLTEKKNLQLIKYETLITHTKQVLHETTRFLDIENGLENNADGNLYLNLAPNHKIIHKNINLPPQTERINAWQENLSYKDKYLIERVAKTNLNQLDYTLIVNQTRFWLEVKAITFVFFDIFRKRLKNIKFKIRFLINAY